MTPVTLRSEVRNVLKGFIPEQALQEACADELLKLRAFGGLTAANLDKANQQVDAILAAEKVAQDKAATGAAWPGRESIPEPIRPLLDAYVSLTGQKPLKSMLMDWLQSGNEWIELGATVQDVRSAYAKAKPANGGGFSVTRPGSLTRTIGEVIGERRARQETHGIDRDAIERTRRMLEERERQYTRPPNNTLSAIKQLSDKLTVKG